jgi:putative DNA primase/helicase
MPTLNPSSTNVKAPRGDKAIAFLKELASSRHFITIAIINPDSGGIQVKTFSEAERCRDYIVEQNKLGWNVHYMSALTRERMRKKPEKADIAWVYYLHVDADPNPGETPQQFKERFGPILKTFKPQPTFIVDSGNGYNLLWELEHRVEITGPDVIDDIESRNHALHLRLGADPETRNIDRLLRVPGTINYPGKAKLAKGWGPCRSYYDDFNSTKYELGDFPRHVEPAKPQTKVSSGTGTELPRRLTTLLHIPNPDHADYPSRSEMLMSFLTGAHKAGFADDVIIDACIDSKYADSSIYEHIAEGGGRRCAERQLERAKAMVASDDKTRQPVKQLEIVRASDVMIRSLQWLWPGHLLRGAQEIMTGQKGLGKSQIHCSFVSSVTTGKKWPDGTPSGEPGNVIMVTAEDALDQVVVPRLIAARADTTRVYFLKAIKQDNKRRMFLLAEDLEALEQMIRDYNAVFVTIDPITAFMGKINSSSPTDVRGQLGPLADLAERTNVAFSTITHPTKAGSGKAIDQFIGSQAFIAAARIGHLIVPEMTVNTAGLKVPTRRNLLTMAATNHKPMPPLAYWIETTPVIADTPPGDRKAAVIAHANATEAVYVEWCGTVEMTADEALASASYKPAATQAIDTFLRDMLRDGPVGSNEIYERGGTKGYSKEQLYRGLRRIGAQPDKEGLEGWTWELLR